MNRIAILGLGYVGFPLCIEFSKSFEVVGFDVSEDRVTELRAGFDRNAQVSQHDLDSLRCHLSSDPSDLIGADFYVVTVPTPVNSDNSPDLAPILGATKLIASALAQPAIVIYESTVWPGFLEDVIEPEFSSHGKSLNIDYFLAYSPERINPGDNVHTLRTIKKVVAADSEDVLGRVADLYSRIVDAGIVKSSCIKSAEFAKVIENTQRDINIAFMNEILIIAKRMGIKYTEVKRLALTKWNFIDFSPGLVGGHCIGVDPFYLIHKAIKLGHDPKIIQSGRSINDSMPRLWVKWIIESTQNIFKDAKPSVLILGRTFKENCNDMRNSKNAEFAYLLRETNKYQVTDYDPLIDREEMLAEVKSSSYNILVLAVPHSSLVKEFGQYLNLLLPNGMVFDIKGAVSHLDSGDGTYSYIGL